MKTIKLPPAIAEGAEFQRPRVRPIGWTEKQLDYWNKRVTRETRPYTMGRHTHKDVGE